jgi:hypothetical protein
MDRASFGNLDAPKIKSRMRKMTISSPPPGRFIEPPPLSSAKRASYLGPDQLDILDVGHLERQGTQAHDDLLDPQFGQPVKTIAHLAHRPSNASLPELLPGYCAPVT